MYFETELFNEMFPEFKTWDDVGQSNRQCKYVLGFKYRLKKRKLVEKTTNIMYTSVAYGDIEYVL